MYPREYKAQRVAGKQQGFLIPVAIFIVAGLGVLVISIARMTSGSHSAVVREAVSVQALFAAESGAQYALSQLLFDATSRNQVKARCVVVDTESISFSAVGLTGCVVELDCQVINNTGGPEKIYEIVSTSSCGSGDLFARRIIEIKARYQ